MCGINGLIDIKKNLNQDQIREFIKNFNLSLKHRGPDGNGLEIINNIGLGHTRLSIIDLSINGKQPMFSRNKKVVISYNGEIYNFENLKEKYLKNYKFISNTDTEVLLNLYTEIGIENLIKELNGMYAFSIYDIEKNKIFLSRDKIGKKPLYYYFGSDYIIWSSELKTFKVSPINNNLEMSENAVRNYFDVGYIPSPLSIFKNIYKLLPGETIEIDLSKFLKKSFFFETNNQNYLNTRINLSNLEETIENAVKIRTISDVPYGVFLSSGIDSSLVASILCKIKGSNINSFSIGLNDSNLDESSNARKIANYLGLNHNELIINEKDLFDTIPNMVDTYSEPFADSSQIPTYILSKFCKKKITVALSGDGGDEIFGGYNRYIYYKRYKFLFKTLFALNKFSLLNNNLIQKILDFSGNHFSKKESFHKIKSLSKIKNLEDFYSKMIKQNNEIEKIFKVNKTFQNYYLKGEKNSDGIKFMQIKDLHNYLPDDILTKVDRASMAHSLEVRCPLLDKRLHNYIGMDNNYKISQKNSKIILKDILKKYIDINLLSKKKMGFGIPLQKWLSNELFETTEDLLNSKLLRDDEFLDQNYILHIWRLNKKGNKSFAYLLWSIIIYLNWKISWQKLV